MRYSNIKNAGKPVSRIIFGTATAPFLHGEDCSAVLSAALAAGINIFDTARVYGRSERAIGRWLQGQDRDGVVIISKCCHPSALGFKRLGVRQLRADLKKSLCELGTDHIDIYLMHRDDAAVPVGVFVEELNELHAKGVIGAFGGSNWSHRRVAEAEEYAYAHGLQPFTVTSPNFSLAEQYRDVWGGGVTISGRQGEEARSYYAATGIAVVAYSALARGFLSGRVTSADVAAGRIRAVPAEYRRKENYIRLARAEELAAKRGVSLSQLALAYVICRGMNAFAVVGSTSAERIRGNAAAAEIDLSREELDYLDLSQDAPV